MAGRSTVSRELRHGVFPRRPHHHLRAGALCERSESCADLLRCSGQSLPSNPGRFGTEAMECILKGNQVASLASSGHQNPLEGMSNTDGRAPGGILMQKVGSKKLISSKFPGEAAAATAGPGDPSLRTTVLQNSGGKIARAKKTNHPAL